MRSTPTRSRVAAAVVFCLTSFAITTVDPPAAGAAGSNSFTATATEYAYRLSGSPATGWTRITFRNAGREYHQLLVVPLKPGVTRAQVQDAVASGDAASVIPAIGTGLAPGLPALLGPGSEATSIARLDRGRYALLSFLNAPDGTSDAANGMVEILTVRAPRSDLTPPTRRVVDVTTSDSGITLPDGTLPERGWARITTTAPSPRDFELFRYSSAEATFELTSAYFKELGASGRPPPGPPPAVIVGLISSIPEGAVVYYRLSLEPARYVVVSDTASDPDGSAQLHMDFTVG